MWRFAYPRRHRVVRSAMGQAVTVLCLSSLAVALGLRVHPLRFSASAVVRLARTIRSTLVGRRNPRQGTVPLHRTSARVSVDLAPDERRRTAGAYLGGVGPGWPAGS
jgi:hypothetical protein